MSDPSLVLTLTPTEAAALRDLLDGRDGASDGGPIGAIWSQLVGDSNRGVVVHVATHGGIWLRWTGALARIGPDGALVDLAFVDDGVVDEVRDAVLAALDAAAAATKVD